MRTGATLVIAGSLGSLVASLGGAGDEARSAAEVAAGREIYGRCAACHAIDFDRTGPRHCGLFGRRAGSVPGFAYSEAMRSSGIVWGRESLDRFLADPLATVPGTFMGYAGISDPRERAQLIAYLEVVTDEADCRGDSDAPRPRSPRP